MNDKDSDILVATLDLLAMGYGKDAPQAEDATVKLYMSSKDGRVRASCIFLISEIKSGKGVSEATLAKALNDTSASVRSHATAGIAGSPGIAKHLIPRLTMLLTDSDVSVRLNVLDAFAGIGTLSDDVVREIDKCTTDTDKEVAEKARTVLQRVRRQ